MNEWLLIGGMTLLTFIPRYLPLALAGRVTIPPLVRRSLAYVPMAVLSCIITQATFVQQGELNLSLYNPFALAAMVAAILAHLCKNLTLTVIVGMSAYYLLVSL